MATEHNVEYDDKVISQKFQLQKYKCLKCGYKMNEETLGSEKIDGQYYRLFCTNCGSNQIKLLT